LTRPDDEEALFALWRDPELVFAQCCWGPMSLGLLPGLRVLAQPDYSDVPGGRGPFYRSAVVMRQAAAGSVIVYALPVAVPQRPERGADRGQEVGHECAAFDVGLAVAGARSGR
jgi:hypothetical protein